MPKWIVYAAASMLCWAVWTLMAPIASRDLSPYMVQVISTAGIVPFALLLLLSRRLRHGREHRKGILLAFGCGAFAGLGNILLYSSLSANGPSSVVFPITAMPLLPVLAGPFLFKERINRMQRLGIGLALTAIVLLNIAPDPAGAPQEIRIISTWMLYALLCMLSYGFAMITQKAATYFISDELSTVVYTVAFVLLAVVLVVTVPALSWQVPARAGWASVFIGVLMGLGTLTFFAAYRHGKATVVSPFILMYPVITVLVSIPLYHEPVDWPRGLGIFFALGAVPLLAVEKSEAAASFNQEGES